MLEKDTAKKFITGIIDEIYLTLKQGYDVSPGDRLRLEGQVELLIAFDVIDWNWIESLVNRLYQSAFHQNVEEDYWNWMKSDKRFYLPVKMREAPVYKT